MAGFRQYLKRQGYSQRTAESFGNDAARYGRWAAQEGLAISEATYQDVMAFIQSVSRGGASTTTATRCLNSIRHYHGYLQSIGEAMGDPTAGIKLQGCKRHIAYDVLTAQELAGLYQSYGQMAGNSPTGQRDKAVLGLLVYQGLGVGELTKLEAAHASLRQGIVEIPASRVANGRVLPLAAAQLLDLQAYLQDGRNKLLKGKANTMLLVGNKGKPGLKGVAYALTKGLKACSGKVKSLHQIRASVIVQWLRQHNLREAQHLAGHKYIGSTERYLQDDLEGLRNDINQYHPEK